MLNCLMPPRMQKAGGSSGGSGPMESHEMGYSFLPLLTPVLPLSSLASPKLSGVLATVEQLNHFHLRTSCRTASHRSGSVRTFRAWLVGIGTIWRNPPDRQTAPYLCFGTESRTTRPSWTSSWQWRTKVLLRSRKRAPPFFGIGTIRSRVPVALGKSKQVSLVFGRTLNSKRFFHS